MSFFFNGAITNESSQLTLSNDGLNRTYSFVCSSVNSRPGVTLSIYDSNSMLSLAKGQINITQSSCLAYNLCTEILQINFQFKDQTFNNMTSVTCSTTSKDNLIPLISTISRNVTVKLVGKKSFLNIKHEMVNFFTYCFFFKRI